MKHFRERGSKILGRRIRDWELQLKIAMYQCEANMQISLFNEYNPIQSLIIKKPTIKHSKAPNHRATTATIATAIPTAIRVPYQ
jgi:hypothetical protein